tara:strand:- start:2512 stop:2673 length:162 start_codon:yes stop_codon:yes gene_type:complete
MSVHHKFYFEVGEWHLWAHENDDGALELWARHNSERHEIYLGEWPIADKEEQG